MNVLRLMEQFGLRHRLVLASVKEEDFGKNYCDNNFFATILAAVKKKDFRTFFGKEYCQRPIVIGFFTHPHWLKIIAFVMKSGTFKGLEYIDNVHIPIPLVLHYLYWMKYLIGLMITYCTIDSLMNEHIFKGNSTIW